MWDVNATYFIHCLTNLVFLLAYGICTLNTNTVNAKRKTNGVTNELHVEI